jgi:hypothetical protein
MDDKLDEVETRILEILHSLPLDAVQGGWKSDRTWTSELTHRIGLLGKERGYYICASGWGAPDGQGGWLYDLVWLSIRGQSIVDVPLVLESEWGIGLKNIDEDFSKLLLARAEHRVMIFQQKTFADVAKVCDFLGNQISAFSRSQRGDRYLLTGLIWTGEQALVIAP